MSKTAVSTIKTEHVGVSLAGYFRLLALVCFGLTILWLIAYWAANLGMGGFLLAHASTKPVAPTLASPIPEFTQPAKIVPAIVGITDSFPVTTPDPNEPGTGGYISPQGGQGLVFIIVGVVAMTLIVGVFIGLMVVRGGPPTI